MALSQETFCHLTASDIAQATHRGDLRATDVLEACLARIQRLDPELHAFITVASDDARARAAELDGMPPEVSARQVLHGVPVAIKDLVDTRGIRTTKGSPRWAHHVPDNDELVVERLRRAGAIIVGKTNTPEFGFGALCENPIAGNTVNPYDRRFTSGGSSGGSAAAVAAGLVPIAHGSDFGGSVRTPASFCGVVGLRPGAGLVPRVPKSLPWDALQTHGVLARTARDAALMMQAVSGGDARDPVSTYAPSMAEPDWGDPRLRSLRVAHSVDLGVAMIDREVAAVFEEACRLIHTLVGEMRPAHPDCTDVQATFETLRGAVIAHELGAVVDDSTYPTSDTVRWNVERGRQLTARSVMAAETSRGDLIQRFLAFFEEHDVLLTVSASIPPFPNAQPDVLEINGQPLRHIIDYLTITFAISVVGVPALSIPCGRTGAGLPVGMQLVGPPRSETRLLAFAELLERELGFRHEFPAGIS